MVDSALDGTNEGVLRETGGGFSRGSALWMQTEDSGVPCVLYADATGLLKMSLLSIEMTSSGSCWIIDPTLHSATLLAPGQEITAYNHWRESLDEYPESPSKCLAKLSLSSTQSDSTQSDPKLVDSLTMFKMLLVGTLSGPLQGGNWPGELDWGAVAAQKDGSLSHLTKLFSTLAITS